MIEKINDFFKDVKERLSNPLISAYLIAWCLYNWKVVIGILFFKSTELKVEGYDSYFDLIRCEVTWRTALLWPLLSAAGYVLIFPFLRNWILVVSAWFKTWGNERVMNVTKTGQISVLKYIALREKYLKSIDDFVQLVKNESTHLQLNKELEQQVAVQAAKILRSEQLDDEISKQNNVNYLNGRYRIKRKLSQIGGIVTFEADVSISDGYVHFSEKISETFDYKDQEVIEKFINQGGIYVLIFKVGSVLDITKYWLLRHVSDGVTNTYVGKDHAGFDIVLSKYMN